MRKIALGLAALLLAAASSSPAAAQPLTAEMTPLHHPDCSYACVYADSVLAKPEADRDQSHFVQSQSETAVSGNDASAPSDRVPDVSRIATFPHHEPR